MDREGACTSSLRFDLESTTSGILEFEPDRPVVVYFSATIAGVVPFLSTVHQLHASPEKRRDVRNKRRSLYTGARFRELGEDKTRLRRGRSNFSSVSLPFVSGFVRRNKGTRDSPRIRGTLPAQPHRTFISWIRLIPLFPFQRLFPEKSTRKIRSKISIYYY